MNTATDNPYQDESVSDNTGLGASDIKLLKWFQSILSRFTSLKKKLKNKVRKTLQNRKKDPRTKKTEFRQK